MYLLIFPDVIITEGAKRTLVFDTKRVGSYFFIPVLPRNIIERFKAEPIEQICKLYEGNDIDVISAFIDFILQNKLGVLVQEIKCFPSIIEEYYSPSFAEIMVVDISKIRHRYSYIASQAKVLFCQHLQLRCFAPISIEEINQILSPFLEYPWLSIEILICNPLWHKPKEIIDFLYDLPMVSVVIFNQNKTKLFKVKSKYNNQSISSVLYVQQRFQLPEDCGTIRPDSLYGVSTIQNVIMAKKYNNCLYKKIFITKNGDVANCPCLPYIYGNIDQQDLDLFGIVQSQSFQMVWKIKKDDIAVCQDCEFRYICNDCRAFVKNISDKPKKCNFNPYLSLWDDDKK